jgi:hypothetical protein
MTWDVSTASPRLLPPPPTAWLDTTDLRAYAIIVCMGTVIHQGHLCLGAYVFFETLFLGVGGGWVKICSKLVGEGTSCSRTSDSGAGGIQAEVGADIKTFFGSLLFVRLYPRIVGVIVLYSDPGNVFHVFRCHEEITIIYNL